MSWYTKSQEKIKRLTVRQIEKLRSLNDEIDTILGYLRFVSDPSNEQQLASVAPPPWTNRHSVSWVSMLKQYLWQILNGLVFEKRFPEDMYFSLVDTVKQENLPKIEQMQNSIQELREIFVRLYDKEHLIRRMLFDMASFDKIRRDTEEDAGNIGVDVPKYLEWKQKNDEKNSAALK